MANNLVWKMNVGPSTHIDTTSTPYHAGYGYLTTDEPSGGFYIDANNKRYHINEVDATLSKSGVAADAAAVNTRFGNILGGSREKHNETLLATGWATPSGQDYAARYDITTLNARYATGEWQMEVNVDSLTGAQRAALMDAEIMNGKSSQYLYAYGTKPDVNIPVVMTAYTEGATAPTSNYIRVTVVGSTDFEDDWLALEGESEALTPEQGLIYLIIDDDYEGSRGVYWDDAADAYIPIATGGGATKTHLPVPVVSATHPSYNPTTPITLASLLSGYDPTIMSLEGVTTTDDGEGGIIDAGTYTAYVKIKLDVVNLYDWVIEDSQTGEIEYVATRQELTWTVDKASLTAPTINGSNSFNYSGVSQGPVFNNLNAGLVTASDTEKVNAGNYNATFAIDDKDNYQWSGGGTSDVVLSWSINKVSPTLSVNVNSWAPNDEGLTQDVTITTNSDGTLGVVSGDTDLVTVGGIVNKTFTMTSVGAGETDITVSVGEGTNWNGGNVTIEYGGDWIDLTRKTFAGCSDAELSEIISKYYKGEISASEIENTSGWEVGSIRAITLTAQSKIGETSSLTGGADYTADNTAISGQTVYLEIIGYEHDTLATPINGKTKALFTLQQQNIITDCNMYWNRGTGDNSSDEKRYGSQFPNGWAGSRIRTWLNAGYDVSSLPSSGTYDNTSRTLTKPTSNSGVGYWKALSNWSLRNVIKPVIKPNYKNKNSSAIDVWTVDPIWLPSEWEVFGSTSNSKGQEGNHYSKKYNSNSARIKQKNGSSGWWWERSVRSSYSYSACRVYSSGNANLNGCGASDAGGGVAPAFCL